MRKQLSTTFSALDEITSTSLDPTPSLGSVLLRGDQSRMVESLLSRLATNPSTAASSASASSSSADTYHRRATPHAYSEEATTTGPPRPTPVPPQQQWAPAAAICYPYRSPPPQPHYYPPPQQYHYLPPNNAAPPLQQLQHHQQQPAQYHPPLHPPPQPPQAFPSPTSWFIPPEQVRGHEPPAVISSHVPPFVDGNLAWASPSAHNVALQPQGMCGHAWSSADAGVAASVVGGTSSSLPSSPFTSTSSLHVFSPGQSSSSDHLCSIGDSSPAVIASFLAGDASDDDAHPAPAVRPAVREKRRRLESGERSTSPVGSGLGPGLAAPHGRGETSTPPAQRKKSDHTQQLQNPANDWFGATESPDSAFFTGSTSSLPLQLFGATSSFSLSPSSAGAAVSSLPSPSSPPQHYSPYGDLAGSRDPTLPYVAPWSLYHIDGNEVTETGRTEEGWPSTSEDAGTRSHGSVRPVVDGGRPPETSSP